MNDHDSRPFRGIAPLNDEIDRVLQSSPFQYLGGENPRVDVYQTPTEVIVKADIPGVAKKDLKISIDANHIQLSGRTSTSGEYQDENVYQAHSYSGSFTRTIDLPAQVQAEEAVTEYRDGILSIVLPKLHQD